MSLLRDGNIAYKRSFDRKLLLVEDYIAIDIRYGNFGGRNQIQIVHFAMIHLTLFVGQLACSVTGSAIDHCRRHYFRIARFACLVQEEVDERTLELCAFSFIYRKARTRDFNTQVKVYQVVFLGQFPVWKRIFGKLGFHTAHFSTTLSSAPTPSGTLS